MGIIFRARRETKSRRTGEYDLVVGYYEHREMLSYPFRDVIYYDDPTWQKLNRMVTINPNTLEVKTKKGFIPVKKAQEILDKHA